MFHFISLNDFWVVKLLQHLHEETLKKENCKTPLELCTGRFLFPLFVVFLCYRKIENKKSQIMSTCNNVRIESKFVFHCY